VVQKQQDKGLAAQHYVGRVMRIASGETPRCACRASETEYYGAFSVYGVQENSDNWTGFTRISTHMRFLQRTLNSMLTAEE